jgi:hypothetical protein
MDSVTAVEQQAPAKRTQLGLGVAAIEWMVVIRAKGHGDKRRGKPQEMHGLASMK